MGDFDELTQALKLAGTAFRKGSRVLVSRGAALIRQDLAWNGGVAAGSVYLAAYELHAHPDLLVYGLPATLVVWTAAAWSVAPDEDQADEDAEDDELDGAEQAAPLSVDELAEACREVGAPHAHIAALAQHLGTTAERVRQCCAAAAIPIGDVRMRGRGVSTGVKDEDFPPLPSSRPEGAVVAEETPAKANNNNSTTWFPTGTRITTRDDPHNPARTIVIVKKGAK